MVALVSPWDLLQPKGCVESMRQKEMRSDDGMTPEKRFRAVTYHARCAKKTALLDTSHRVTVAVSPVSCFFMFHLDAKARSLTPRILRMPRTFGPMVSEILSSPCKKTIPTRHCHEMESVKHQMQKWFAELTLYSVISKLLPCVVTGEDASCYVLCTAGDLIGPSLGKMISLRWRNTLITPYYETMSMSWPEGLVLHWRTAPWLSMAFGHLQAFDFRILISFGENTL